MSTRQHRRGLRTFTAIVALAIAAAACGDSKSSSNTTSPSTSAGIPASTAPPTTAKETPVAGGSASIQLFSEIGTLDPLRGTGSGGSDGQRMFALYGALIAFDGATQSMQGVLADSLKPVGTDYTKWQLLLKPGLKFIDGTPLDADAVKANWDREAVPANRCSCLGVSGTIASSTATNATTLDIVLKTPNAHFDKGVERVVMNYIASKKAIDDKTDLTQKAIGAGPFKLDSWTRDSTMVMSKNPDWLAGKSPVYLDKLTFVVQPNEQQRVDSFNTGAADAFYTSVPGSIDAALKGSKDSYQVKIALTTGQTFVMNNAKAPFDDVRIRKAIIEAFPRDVLAKTILNNSVPADFFSVPGTPWHSANAALPKYDKVDAQKLIDSYVADKGGPVKFTMLAFQQTLDQDRANFILSQLNQLKNLQVDIQVNDSTTNITKVLAGDYQWSSWGFPTLDPEPGLYNAARSGLPTNYSKYVNADVDKNLDAARVTLDNTIRYKAYQAVYEQLAKDLPFFPYIVTENSFACSGKLRGCALYEDGILRFDLLWKKA
jgi:peptide/nickel transport system substrate-binding protein